jgi:hypothetical protein
MTRRVLLILVLAGLVLRLAGFIFDVGRTSLQMDLSSFYAAGQAVDAGLSPYVNHVEQDPPIWDGVDRFRHSRFLYPPLAARLFQPLSWISYGTVKYLWMVASLAALTAAIGIAIRRTIGLSVDRMLIGAAVVVGFFPTMALLERGQVDAFTLLAIVAAVSWPRGRRSTFAAGAFLALATLLKLHCIFLLPFLALRRRWRLLGGFAAGLVALFLLGGVVDGFSALPAYVTDEMPRISRYGESGSREMALPPPAFQRVMRGVERGKTVMEGRSYEPEHFRFVLNASAVRTPIGGWIWSSAKAAGFPLAPGHVSLVFLALGLGLVALLARGAPESSDLLHAQVALVVVMLSAPVTWAMNVVWLLPVVPILLMTWDPAAARLMKAGWWICAVGLILAGLPDSWLRAVTESIESRYLVALTLCLGGLLVLVRKSGRDAPIH